MKQWNILGSYSSHGTFLPVQGSLIPLLLLKGPAEKAKEVFFRLHWTLLNIDQSENTITSWTFIPELWGSVSIRMISIFRETIKSPKDILGVSTRGHFVRCSCFFMSLKWQLCCSHYHACHCNKYYSLIPTMKSFQRHKKLSHMDGGEDRQAPEVSLLVCCVDLMANGCHWNFERGSKILSCR